MEWETSGIAKIEGDPWTVADANAWPRSSRRSVAQWSVAHDPQTGRHLMPAPAAAAIVEWDGSRYQIHRADGIMRVDRIDVGTIEIELEEPMANSDGWIATGLPTGLPRELVPAWVYEDQQFARTSTVTRLRIAGLALPRRDEASSIWWRPTQLRDASLVIEVWGERL